MHIRTISQKIISCGLVILFTISSGFVFGSSKVNAETNRFYNINRHYYDSYCANLAYSFITATSDGGFMIFDGHSSGNGYSVEYYDSSFKLKSSKNIPVELPLFGSFYSDGSNYYILSGQSNINDSDEVECFRLTKYSLSWSRLSSCLMKACNTSMPFRAGCPDITSSGSKMVIRTSHLMYKSSDGKNHQSNITFFVDTSTMTSTERTVGYCSHSFNQFVRIDNNRIVAADHGDAYPRCINLYIDKYNVQTGEVDDSLDSFSKRILNIKGATGNNTTGATLGGLELSGSSYIVVGSSIDQSESSKSEVRNIYIGTVSRSDDRTQNFRWLTDYKSSVESASNPHFVKINDDRFLIMWNQDYGSLISYAFVDGKGNLIGNIQTADGLLSDCHPILYKGNVIWYTSWSDGINFFKINASTGAFSSYNPLPISSANIDVHVAFAGSGEVKPPVDISFGNTKLVEGKDFTVSYLHYQGKDWGKATITGTGNYCGSAEEYFSVIDKPGWVSYGDAWYYYDSTGAQAKGWKKIGDTWYYFDERFGEMKTGLQVIKDKTYYFDESGAMFTGWKLIDDSWHYFDKAEGEMAVSWKKIGGSWYYFDKISGGMVTGWNQIGSDWYYFDKTNGDMATGWKQINGKWYFLDKTDGNAAKGWKQKDGKWYYFDPSENNMITGWKQIDGKWYFFDRTNGDAAMSWKQIDGKWYYFDKTDNYMVTSWKQIGGSWYYFDKTNGDMATGWKGIGGSWYYFDKTNGNMVTGKKTIDGVEYLFDNSGALVEK